jgi:hypothetical protein
MTDVSEHGIRDIQALSIDPDVYDRIDAPSRTSPQSALVQIGSPAVALMDLPLWSAAAEPQSGYVAAMQKPWSGSVAVYMSPQTTGYQLKAMAGVPATLGTTLDAFVSGPEGRLDHRAKFRVRLTNGTIASADLVTMLGGANLAAVRNASGDWEIIQFLTATLVDVQTYELGELLRGQFGTEGAISDPLPAGAQFVLLDGAVTRIPIEESELKLPLNWRYGPGNRDIGNASYVTVPFTFQGLGLRPLSPTRVRGARASGDISISWIRRTRSGGDNWEAPDVPLGEESESYAHDRRVGTSRSLHERRAGRRLRQRAIGGVDQDLSDQHTVFGRGAPRAAVI